MTRTEIAVFLALLLAIIAVSAFFPRWEVCDPRSALPWLRCG